MPGRRDRARRTYHGQFIPREFRIYSPNAAIRRVALYTRDEADRNLHLNGAMDRVKMIVVGNVPSSIASSLKEKARYVLDTIAPVNPPSTTTASTTSTVAWLANYTSSTTSTVNANVTFAPVPHQAADMILFVRSLTDWMPWFEHVPVVRLEDVRKIKLPGSAPKPRAVKRPDTIRVLTGDGGSREVSWPDNVVCWIPASLTTWERDRIFRAAKSFGAVVLYPKNQQQKLVDAHPDVKHYKHWAKTMLTTWDTWVAPVDLAVLHNNSMVSRFDWLASRAAEHVAFTDHRIDMIRRAFLDPRRLEVNLQFVYDQLRWLASKYAQQVDFRNDESRRLSAAATSLLADYPLLKNVSTYGLKPSDVIAISEYVQGAQLVRGGVFHPITH